MAFIASFEAQRVARAARPEAPDVERADVVAPAHDFARRHERRVGRVVRHERVEIAAVPRRGAVRQQGLGGRAPRFG